MSRQEDQEDSLECAACGGPIEPGEMVFYVTDSGEPSFCSESCIGSFYQPFIEELLGEVEHNRKSDDISESDYLNYRGHFEQTAHRPDEVWQESDGIGGVRYTHISKFKEKKKTFWFVLVCTHLNEKPSFVLMGFPTKDPNLMNYFRRGEELDLEAQEESSEAPEELSEHASERGLLFEQEANDESLYPEDHYFDEDEEDEAAALAASLEDPNRDVLTQELKNEMTEAREGGDIPLDEFEFYGHLEEETIEEPDEIYQWRSTSGKKMLTYIATFGAVDEGKTEIAKEVNAPSVLHAPISEALTYVVVCEVLEDPNASGDSSEFEGEKNQEQELAVPLLSFPTLSSELASLYRRGKRLDLGDPIH